jgi:hypothetical protein
MIVSPYSTSNPQPQEYTYKSPLDQSTWSLPSQLTLSGSKDWKTSALAEQQLTQQQQLEAARKQAQSGAAQAQSQMAMRGGLSSGARERAIGGGIGNLMNANTQISMAGAQERAGIGTQAQQMGMQEQQGNIANILSQSQLANQAAQQKYATQMAGWAGKEYANAQRMAASQDTGKK